jgi:hypothetical protein
MKVCSNCFSDIEIQYYIKTSKLFGDCNICNSSNQALLPIEELLDFFQALINNYQITEKGETLNAKIQSHWSLFSTHSNAQKILNIVLPKLQSSITSANSLVDYTDEINQNFGYWEILKDELKWKNRFVLNIDKMKELEWDTFFNTQFELKCNVLLYRARLHHQSGLTPKAAEISAEDNMFCPPQKYVGAGRANPSGIPFLYLSDNADTTLYEVRASYLDELSIGEFSLNDSLESIKIVDFSEDTSLFQEDLNNISNTIKGKLLREKISIDLSKPMRRYDNEIEYIPTQFICEYIKVFTGAHGIKFSSSLHPLGNNFVIFNQSLMKCNQVKLVRVNSIELKSIQIS